MVVAGESRCVCSECAYVEKEIHTSCKEASTRVHAHATSRNHTTAFHSFHDLPTSLPPCLASSHPFHPQTSVNGPQTRDITGHHAPSTATQAGLRSVSAACAGVSGDSTAYTGLTSAWVPDGDEVVVAAGPGPGMVCLEASWALCAGVVWLVMLVHRLSSHASFACTQWETRAVVSSASHSGADTRVDTNAD